MPSRQRQFVAVLLLVVWPMAMSLAMVWHDHSHDCAGGVCHQHLTAEHDHGSCDHHHIHSHGQSHHHSHEHSHSHSEPGDREDSAPTHDPSTCVSCQLLALPATIAATVEVNLLTFDVSQHLPMLESLTSAALPGESHLRGPPVSKRV